MALIILETVRIFLIQLKNEYDWLLNIWGYKIFRKNFLSKFKKKPQFTSFFLTLQ